ncbi:DUF1553 domain-containing protein [soil metagenome]
MNRRPLLLTVPLLIAGMIYAADHPPITAPKPGAKLEYNRDVRPILAENCFACHGADSAARKADLKLHDRDAALASKAFVPGKPDESELVKRILLKDDDDELMPPVKSHKTLKPEQKAILKRWVQEGAEYQPHWAFIAPTMPKIPAIKSEWIRNPIDSFVLMKMQEKGLAHAAEADRRTLARRLSLDLTGLPPEPDAVDAFVKDTSKDWYEKYVDKLMATPQWGEHRGRYWLDAARYADTHGIHFDNYREMWSYREWVINAFNRNEKFDQFTLDQLAGDLLPNATLDQKVATGFNRCNITTNEGGIIDEEYFVLYTKDRTETAGQVFMGLTVGCAVCHDHKFDPISQKEFYSLAAFFNNTTTGSRDGNIHNPPPIMVVPRAEDRPKWESVFRKAEDLRKAMDARKQAARKDHDAWVLKAKASLAEEMIPTTGLAFHAPLDEGKGKEFLTIIDGEFEMKTVAEGETLVGPAKKDGELRKSLGLKAGAASTFKTVGDFDVKTPFTVATWVKPSKRNVSGALFARMDNTKAHRGWDVLMQSDRVATHLIDTWPAKALKVTTKATLKLNEWTHVTVTYDGSAKPSGVKIYFNGDLQPTDTESETLDLTHTMRTNVPFKIGQRHNADRIANANLADIRIYTRTLPQNEVEQAARAPHVEEILHKPAAKRTPKEKDDLFNWWLMTFDKDYRQLDKDLAAVSQEEVAMKSRGTIAHVTNEKPGEAMAFILNRGEYDQRRDKVTAGTPKALPKFPDDLPRNRLGFAKWLLSPEHPLMTRVTVNRFWQELFGNGLVRTAGDFGITGEQPSHPELLDWLALDFRSDWDVKRFFKMMVTSATYRQSAVTTKEKQEKDPANIYLSHGPRFRMDAEMIRDYALATSGLLVPKIGGPSVKPYQPDGVWEAVAMIGSNTRNYKQDTGEALYRRSMYTFWKRAAPPASMEVLNAPNRETCAVRRERTNTPLQALLTLNDVQFVEAARVLAERTLKAGSDDAARLDSLAKRLLARSFTDKELPIVQQSLAELKKEFAAKPDEAKKLIAFGESKADAKLDAGELAAWTMLANQVLNTDEVLNK